MLEWWRVSSFFSIINQLTRLTLLLVTDTDSMIFHRGLFCMAQCVAVAEISESLLCVCVQDTGVLTPSLEISSKPSQSTIDLFEVENCLLKDCLKYRRKTRDLLFSEYGVL